MLKIELKAAVGSLAWRGDWVIDPTRGTAWHSFDGASTSGNLVLGSRFDQALASPSGRFMLAYERHGTKGVLLENDRIVRQIDRSYNFASVFDFPVALFLLPDGTEAMAHCPNDYNRLEIETLRPRRRLTSRRPLKGALDVFHSRLEVSPGGVWLLSAGRIRHPVDALALYELQKALQTPETLDDEAALDLFWTLGIEVASTTFLTDSALAITTRLRSDEWVRKPLIERGQLAILDPGTRSIIGRARLTEDAGTLMRGGPDHLVAFFQSPKLLEASTGRIVRRWPEIFSGRQLSSISWPDEVPPMALDPARGRFAIANGHTLFIETELFA